MVFSKSAIITPVVLGVVLAIVNGCSSNSDDDNSGTTLPIDTCEFNGQISGELNYTVNHDISAGCGGAATPDSELITSFGGIGSEPNIKIYHENFQPGIVANNRTAHIVIHRRAGDNREWGTALGACTVNITANEYTNGEVKISGSGSCNSPALPDTNSGATTNITIAPFTFESIRLTWP